MISEPILIKTKKFFDSRGYFFETYKKSILCDLGIDTTFVQDNHSFSKKNVIRGMHYQWDLPMGKLVRCSFGKVMDVVVDIRIKSINFGKVYYYELSEENGNQVYIPAGFAHGFLALEDSHLQYKCTSEYNKNGESGINPFDKELNINWNLNLKNAIISDKDLNSSSFCNYKKNFKF